MPAFNTVLRSPPPDEELQPLVERIVRSWDRTLGLLLVYRGVLHREPGMVIRWWTDAHRPEVEVHLVLDDVARFRYVTALAPEEELCERMWRALESALDSVPTEELRTAARLRGDHDPDAYMRLVIGLSGRFDAETLSLLRDALRSPESSVRAGAAEGAAIVHWPQLIGELEAALEREAVQEVANVLAFALAACRDEARRGEDGVGNRGGGASPETRP